MHNCSNPLISNTSNPNISNILHFIDDIIFISLIFLFIKATIPSNNFSYIFITIVFRVCIISDSFNSITIDSSLLVIVFLVKTLIISLSFDVYFSSKRLIKNSIIF